MSKVVNSLVAKQLMVTLKMIENQLKFVADSKHSIPQTAHHTVSIDEEKITPTVLQRINQTLIEIYVDLSDGITVEFPERTYEAVQPPLSFYPAAQQFFSGQSSLDPFGGFHSTLLNTVNRPTFASEDFMNDEDRRLLFYVQDFTRNMQYRNQTFIDLYCQLLEKEPEYFVQGKCYKLLYRDVTGANIQQHRTYEIATDIRFFNHFNALPITRLSIECVE